jgi:hypothetical protein
VSSQSEKSANELISFGLTKSEALRIREALLWYARYMKHQGKWRHQEEDWDKGKEAERIVLKMGKVMRIETY